MFSELTCIIGLISDYLQIPGEEDRNPVGSSSAKEKIEAVADTDSDMQESYEKMLKEKPEDPLLLKSYARFLHQVRLFCYVLFGI